MNIKESSVALILATVFGCTGGVVSSWVLMDNPALAQKTSQQEKVITAEGFHLVDKAGVTRAVLSLNEMGVSLVLRDENGKMRLGLGSAIDFQGLVLYDKNEQSRVMVSQSNDGSSLSIKNGRTQAMLTVFEDGPKLLLYGENNKLRAGLGLTKDAPGLIMYDKNKTNRIILAPTEIGPGLTIFNKDGTATWSAP